MIINQLSEIKRILDDSIKKYPSIGIVTHKNPDGDGFCASLVLRELLVNKGIKADIVLEEPARAVYDFLQGSERTIVFSEHLRYDFLIILDCHEEERIGICVPLIPTAKKIIAIDHHLEHGLIPDTDTYIDTKTVSVGAILFKMYKDEIDSLPAESSNYIAKALYITILNDTDNFLNANVDAETFSICSSLMKYKIKPGQLTELFLLSKPANEMRFVGEVLSTIQTYDDGQILFIDSTIDMLRRNNLGPEANTKLTRWVKGTKNVKVTVCFQEVSSTRYRMSLRSNYINVNKIAVKYGGGGHEKASGCEIKDNLDDVKKIILDEIREQL